MCLNASPTEALHGTAKRSCKRAMPAALEQSGRVGASVGERESERNSISNNNNNGALPPLSGIIIIICAEQSNCREREREIESA